MDNLELRIALLCCSGYIYQPPVLLSESVHDPEPVSTNTSLTMAEDSASLDL